MSTKRKASNLTEQITWHLAEDVEPDDGIDVLVLTPSPSTPVWIGHMDDGEWYWADGQPIAYNVIAWSDLPAGEVF